MGRRAQLWWAAAIARGRNPIQYGTLSDGDAAGIISEIFGGAGADTYHFGDDTATNFGDDEITDFSLTDGDLIQVDAAPGFDPTTVVVSDDGTNTVLDFGFGTIQLDGVTGGATPFTTIDDINVAAGSTVIEVV